MMFRKLIITSLPVVLLVLSVNTLAAESVRHSNFVAGQENLDKCNQRYGSYCYMKPGIQLQNYRKVAFTPIEFRLHPQSEYHGVRPDDYLLVSNMFHQTMIGQLEPDYPVVTNADASTLAVRVALVDIKLKNTVKTLPGYAPTGLVVGRAQDIASNKLRLQDAALETELLDGATGERLAVLVDQNLYDNRSDTKSWESMRQMVNHYAKRIKAHLDKAHKKQITVR